jgi:transcriptional regulator with XRE-family HTH domain
MVAVERSEYLTPLQRFGVEVREVRRGRRITQRALGSVAGYSEAYVSRVEKGTLMPSENFAHACDSLFQTSGLFERLRAQLADGGSPSWFAPYVQLERKASSVRAFECQIIPGFLQTEDYARAMLSSVRPENLEELVAARMARRVILDGGSPTEVWAIVDEQTLRRKIGGAEVMRQQLEHVLDAMGRPRTIVQVIPETVPAHAGLAGPFTLLSFMRGPDALYVDAHSQGRLSHDRAEIAVAVRSYDLLRAVALSPEDSAELIGRYAKGLK